MKHDLIIHCFGKWWKAESDGYEYYVTTHLLELVVPPEVLFHSKIVYDKTEKKLLKNKNKASLEQIKLEVWLLDELPVLNLKHRAFKQQRKSYERLKKIEKDRKR